MHHLHSLQRLNSFWISASQYFDRGHACSQTENWLDSGFRRRVFASLALEWRTWGGELGPLRACVLMHAAKAQIFATQYGCDPVSEPV